MNLQMNYKDREQQQQYESINTIIHTLSDMVKYLTFSYCRFDTSFISSNSYLQIDSSPSPLILSQLLCFFTLIGKDKSSFKKDRKINPLIQNETEISIYQDKQLGSLPVLLKRTFVFPYQDEEDQIYNNLDYLSTYIIGLYLNVLRAEIPNFMYTYFMFFCDDYFKENKPIRGCQYKYDPHIPHLFIEHIKGDTLELAIKNEEYFFDCLLQILLALALAQDRFHYCHGNINNENIIIQQISEPITIQYHIRNKIYLLTVKNIATIINFKESHLRLSNDVLNELGNVKVSQELLQEFPLRSILATYGGYRPDMCIVNILKNVIGNTYKHHFKEYIRKYDVNKVSPLSFNNQLTPIHLVDFILSKRTFPNLEIKDITTEFVHEHYPMSDRNILQSMIHPELKQLNFREYVMRCYECILNEDHNFKSLVYFIHRTIILLQKVKVSKEHISLNEELQNKQIKVNSYLQNLLDLPKFTYDKIIWDLGFARAITENKHYLHYTQEIIRIVSMANVQRFVFIQFHKNDQPIKLGLSQKFKSFVEMMNAFLHFMELFVNVINFDLIPKEVREHYKTVYSSVRNSKLYRLYYFNQDKINFLYENVSVVDLQVQLREK